MFGRKVMSRLARQRVGANAGNCDLPHALVFLARIHIVSCMLACAHILLTGDIACACRKMLALACSPDGALSNLAGPDDQNSNEVRRPGKHANMERRCLGKASYESIPFCLPACLSVSVLLARSHADWQRRQLLTATLPPLLHGRSAHYSLRQNYWVVTHRRAQKSPAKTRPCLPSSLRGYRRPQSARSRRRQQRAWRRFCQQVWVCRDVRSPGRVYVSGHVSTAVGLRRLVTWWKSCEMVRVCVNVCIMYHVRTMRACKCMYTLMSLRSWPLHLMRFAQSIALRPNPALSRSPHTYTLNLLPLRGQRTRQPAPGGCLASTAPLQQQH